MGDVSLRRKKLPIDIPLEDDSSNVAVVARLLLIKFPTFVLLPSLQLDFSPLVSLSSKLIDAVSELNELKENANERIEDGLRFCFVDCLIGL